MQQTSYLSVRLKSVQTLLSNDTIGQNLSMILQMENNYHSRQEKRNKIVFVNLYKSYEEYFFYKKTKEKILTQCRTC